MVFLILDFGYIWTGHEYWLYWHNISENIQIYIDIYVLIISLFFSTSIVEAPMVYYFLSIIVGMRDCICFANFIGVASLDRMTVFPVPASGYINKLEWLALELSLKHKVEEVYIQIFYVTKKMSVFCAVWKLPFQCESKPHLIFSVVLAIKHSSH